MTTTRRTLTAAAVITAATLALGACGSSKPAEPAASPSSAATTAEPTQAPSATASSVPTVPGYRPGEIPPVPAFAVPPIDVFASNADKAVIQTASTLSSVPGVTVSPAKCDGNALVSGSTVLGGDGSGVTTNSSGTVVNGGDGSGVITQGPISIVYGGDGTGVYTNADTGLSINVNEDGSGVYSTPTLSINLDGMGGGNYTDSFKTISIINNGDGSGNYSTATVSIINNGDGSGSYSDSTMTIRNNGDGTAVVNGTTVTDAPKVDKVSKLGKFPPITSLQPVESCGTLITLEDGVLFDFGKSDIRPDAAQTLKSLAGVLNNAKVPAAHIYGHTDSVSDEAFNQQLSEARANAVKNDLAKNGVTATLDATGYGESKPVAPNENADGSDNPAGRALNRRVEIFIPAF
ncbi:OmpA family protein [Actinomyces sp. ICM58]|uniref:OmpA family protein n=1 Tax=unclassified Actinomyces TaxID=2609248 RepID=UPI0002772637|nr:MULTISPECIES: OmpA family protein [unclassified Actinomyces]EJN51112.1 OmpA family protein [Actinomyces sp. ICM58]